MHKFMHIELFYLELCLCYCVIYFLQNIIIKEISVLLVADHKKLTKL